VMQHHCSEMSARCRSMARAKIFERTLCTQT
jgi:hypothetical protein